MEKSYFRKNTEPKIQYVVNLISTCSAAITFIIILVLAFFRRQIINRVTLRFQGLIALIDIAKHINFFNLNNVGGGTCAFIGFIRNFIDIMYVFTHVLIAINLQLIYIHNILPNPMFEVFYLLGAISLGFVIDLIPIAYSAYGSNSIGYCSLKQPLQHRLYFKLLIRYIPIFPSLVYCIVIFIWVYISLFNKTGYLEEKFPSKKVTIFGETMNGRDFVKKLYFRMGLYPLSSVICVLPGLSSDIFYDIYNYFPDWVVFTVRFCNRLSGFMSLISLLCDPHFQVAMRSIYKNGLKNNQINSRNYSLQELGSIKKEDEEYLINFPGEESIRFEDFIKLL